jgi:lipid A 4'-phosphatase
MNRTGLLIALGIAVAVGLIFGVQPGLDLKLAGRFYDPGTSAVWLGDLPLPRWLRWLSLWLVVLIAAPAVVALLVKLWAPHRPLLLPGRAILLMLVTLALGPGLVTNVVLKNHWHRPRPVDVTEFAGPQQFVPWWDPRGACVTNCSFVGGEASGAFWTLAPAALVPPSWRAFAYAGGLAFGAGVGVLRMAAGGHFFSDVAFAGVFTFLVIWLAYRWLYRGPAAGAVDAAVERILESAAAPVHRALGGMAARRRRRRAEESSRDAPP